jgi:hypothetical protein
MLSLILAAALQTPQPGEVKEFDRWAVGCDNGRTCQAVSLLGHEDDDFPPIAIVRGPERWARPTLILHGQSERRCTSLAMFVDGRRLPQRLDLGCGHGRAKALGEATEAFVAAVRVADRLELKDTGGRVVGRFSLKGASAALRYMDEKQHRAGTGTALVAVGTAPDSAVPPPPPLPVVKEVRPARPAKGRPLSARLADPWLTKHDCSRRDHLVAPSSYRLDDRQYLFFINCHFGSQDTWPLVLTARSPDGRGARPARFDYDSSINDAPGASDAPVNADWDEAKGRLTSGWSGECGFIEEWVWDGEMFRLVEHSQMNSGTIDRFSANCRADLPLWIPLWRASVVPGGRR